MTTARDTSERPRRESGLSLARKGDEPMARAIAYLRVSTAIQKEEGFGLAVQRDRIQAFAAEKGWQLLAVVEEAASGGVQNGEEFSWEHRPVLLSLMERAEAGDYDVLLVPRYDRLSRDYATLIVLERRFARYRVEIVSAAEEQNGDGPIAAFIRGQLALAAELERATIRDRLSAGKARAKQAGRHVHGRIAYGYRSAARGLLEPDPEQAETVRRIFREIARGISPGMIARALNGASVPTPKGGKQWTDDTVRTIATNPAYVAPKPAAHKAIVSRRLFNQAQAALRERSRPRE